MTIESILSCYHESIALLVLHLREYLFSKLPGVMEEVDEKAKIISYHYGPGYKNVICVIILSKNGVKLGFNKGSELPDPWKLLTGTGKVHRFVVIRSVETLKNPALETLLAEAHTSYVKRSTQK